MKNEKDIKLTFVGDLMCQKEQLSLIRDGSRTFDEIFSGVKDLFISSDYVIGNLETPIAGERNLGYTSTHTCFNTPREFVEAIKNSGIDFVSTGSNHCMDRGLSGLDETLNVLDLIGLDHSGTYLSEKVAGGVFIKEINGVKIAIITPTYGVNSRYGRDPVPDDKYWKVDMLRPCDPMEYFEAPVAVRLSTSSKDHVLKKCLRSLLPERLLVAIRAFRAYSKPSAEQVAAKIDKTRPRYQYDNVSRSEIGNLDQDKFVARIKDKIKVAQEMADFVVVYPHVGGQFSPGPGLYAKLTLKWMSDMGVPLIVANHAHVPQRHEVSHNGTHMFYALGNFTFTPGVGWYVEGMLADYSYVLNVYVSPVDKSITRLTFTPVRSIVEEDGFSRVVTVKDLSARFSNNSQEMEALVAENERLVNRVCGTARTVAIESEYTIFEV